MNLTYWELYNKYKYVLYLVLLIKFYFIGYKYLITILLGYNHYQKNSRITLFSFMIPLFYVANGFWSTVYAILGVMIYKYLTNDILLNYTKQFLIKSKTVSEPYIVKAKESITPLLKPVDEKLRRYLTFATLDTNAMGVKKNINYYILQFNAILGNLFLKLSDMMSSIQTKLEELALSESNDSSNNLECITVPTNVKSTETTNNFSEAMLNNLMFPDISNEFPSLSELKEMSKEMVALNNMLLSMENSMNKKKSH